MNDDLHAELRENDRRAYLAALLAPAEARQDNATLATYALELARVPLVVSEPPAGEIRLQWWEEVVRGERDEQASGHPLAAALRDAASRAGWATMALADMADARRFDLYNEPMPDRAAFEGYAGRIASIPIQLAVQRIDPAAANKTAEAAGHAGVYATLIDRLTTLARDRAANRQFLPSDMLWLAGIAPGTLGSVDAGSDEARALVNAALDTADEHLDRTLAARAKLPRSTRPAFAAALARRAHHAEIRRMGADVFDRMPALSPLREQWAVWRAS